ncbi:MAG: FAD-dependent oxidoreductase, partial [Ginsengibacter sp.]
MIIHVNEIRRRKFLKATFVLSAIALMPRALFAFSKDLVSIKKRLTRVRPGDPEWPSPEKWQRLKNSLQGNLIKVESPLNACHINPAGNQCAEVFKELKNPYYIGDTPAFTQTTGWLNAWESQPSVYAIEAHSTTDIVAGVNFARENNLRLVIKGGGHSYQGNSSAPDSLLIWTRKMNKISLHNDFMPKGNPLGMRPEHAVTIESGAIWFEAYQEVTTKNGRYVQGGGCATVGIPGLIQGGGFGSFSKHYGLAAAALLEAEVVTANGDVITVNEYNHPELFWALKGGGGGSFAIMAKLTLRTRELPETFGAVFGMIKASSDSAFRKLIETFIGHYHEKLFNHHWGEQVSFHADNTMQINMLSFGLTKEDSQAAWQSFENWVLQDPAYSFQRPLTHIILPAKHLWDTDFLRAHASSLIAQDDRPNASPGNVFWLSNKEEAGQFLWGYRSVWLSQTLLPEKKRDSLVGALFNASRQWTVGVHFNKGLAGAPPKEIEAAKNSAINPVVLDAFALVIIAGQGNPAFKGIVGHEPNLEEAESGAKAINLAMNEILKIVDERGAY